MYFLFLSLLNWRYIRQAPKQNKKSQKFIMLYFYEIFERKKLQLKKHRENIKT